MLEKVSLFQNKRDFFHFLFLCFTLFVLSLSLEFYNYKELTKFDSQLVNATVIKQYTKTKTTKTGKTKTYQVLKLKSEHGVTFYTTASIKLSDIKYKKVELEVWAGKISFRQYFRGFYAWSKILNVTNTPTLKSKLNAFIDKQHQNKDISLLYQALFSAKPLPYNLQIIFSNLGVSHLIAISGFHLGVLSALLFFLLKRPYTFLQNRYFPYRSFKHDSFILISITLLAYLLFLDSPPSLLRAFVMFIIGFILYDRGIQIISMQTLLITTLLLLALVPRLFFSIGFWLSISGVFYIFLFLIHYKHLSKIVQFLLLPLWVYIMMLPYSLVIFGNFSLYHPLSIVWTSLFSLFYPLSILFHILNHGNLVDDILKSLINLETNAIKVIPSIALLIIEIILSFGAIFYKKFVSLLLLYSNVIFFYFFFKVLI